MLLDQELYYYSPIFRCKIFKGKLLIRNNFHIFSSYVQITFEISGYLLIFCYWLRFYKMNKQNTIFAIVAVVAAVGLAATTIATSNLAYAKISSQTTDTSCTNGGGNEPGGQQPSCTGGGLTQNTETTNVNPSGSAPPGQNK
jgi:hypothetical protein